MFNHPNDPVGDALADKMHELNIRARKLKDVEGTNDAEVSIHDCYDDSYGSLSTRCVIEWELESERSIECFANQLEAMAKEAREIIRKEGE